MRRYRTVFTREALDFLVAVKATAFGEIEQWVERIERDPAMRGDYTERSDDGRELQVVVLRAAVITWWIDDAAQEVRVVEIESL